MEIDVLTGLETKLLQMSKAITDHKDGRFRNMSASDGEGYAEFKEVFPEYEGLMIEYVSKVHSLFDAEDLKHVPLPPFIVFPTYSPTTIGWRMGAGEFYSRFWRKMLNPLSETEKREYCGKYDYPTWWMDPAYWAYSNRLYLVKPSAICSRYFFMPWRNKSGQK